MQRPVPYRRALDIILFTLAFGFLLLTTLFAHAETVLLNVSYDPTRELYKQVNEAFAAEWQAATGESVRFQTSHGGSAAQARSVIDGLRADVVTLATSADIDAIVERTGRIAKDWQQRLPENSTPYRSTIVFLVRSGNPKGIHDWSDLARPGVSVITPNPRTSGGARWNYLAAWGYAEKKFAGDDEKAKSFVAAIYHNAPVLDTGARGATVTFAERGLGDALVAWENEAFLAVNEFGKDKFEIVVPPMSILTEPPVAVVDANVDAKGTRRLAEAYLKFLYSPRGQQIIAKNYYRPIYDEYADAADLQRFPKLDLITIKDAFGGWAKAQARHFASGGIFDEIQRAGH
jgi:sulfate/thiosulfate transport system substrate-binding protein